MYFLTHYHRLLKMIIVGLFMMVSSFHAVAAIEIYDFDSPAQEQQFHQLTQTIRCPKCQNNTIGDSNAELAQDLRHKVYDMTKEGKSEQEIIDYMVARYGNFVTYNPPITLATAILWVAPLLVLTLGFSLVIVRSRNNRKSTLSASEKWDDEKEKRLNQLLDESTPSGSPLSATQNKNGEHQ